MSMGKTMGVGAAVSGARQSLRFADKLVGRGAAVVGTLAIAGQAQFCTPVCLNGRPACSIYVFCTTATRLLSVRKQRWPHAPRVSRGSHTSL